MGVLEKPQEQHDITGHFHQVEGTSSDRVSWRLMHKILDSGVTRTSEITSATK